MNNDFFEKHIKPVFMYVGTIGASLLCIAYIVTVIVLIQGFDVDKSVSVTTFAIVNAIVGLLIVQFAKIQGIDFAKNRPENKVILEQYYGTKIKNKKNHSLKYFWFTTVVKDVFSKGLTLSISTIGVIYLVLEGSKDYKLLALAIVNLIMFICFGMLSLVKAYEFYNNSHIQLIKEKLEENKNGSNN